MTRKLLYFHIRILIEEECASVLWLMGYNIKGMDTCLVKVEISLSADRWSTVSQF